MQLTRRACRSCQAAFETISLQKSPAKSHRQYSTPQKDPSSASETVPTLSTPLMTKSTDNAGTILVVANHGKVPQGPFSKNTCTKLKQQTNKYILNQDTYSAPWGLRRTRLPTFQHPSTAVPSSAHQHSAELRPAEAHPMRSVDDLDEATRLVIDELVELLRKHNDVLLSAAEIDTLFELYESLPSPRVCYLDRQIVRKTLTVVAQQNKHINSIARRYRAIIDDMQQNHTFIRQSEWSGLIEILGKGFSIDKDLRMQMTTKALTDMERTGLEPDIVTLTTLLASAVRDDQFSLADIIQKDMNRRNLEQNIITWTERVRQAGKQKNVQSILMIFHEFCQTKIPVDIVFVNTLLEAFLTADRPQLAELIYLRLRGFARTCMKRGSHPSRPELYKVRRSRRHSISTDYISATRNLERQLAARRIDSADLVDGDGSPSLLYKDIIDAVTLHQDPQKTFLIPQHGTIRLFISYHCHYTGRMGDVAFYLNDMGYFGVVPKYGVYVDILHGFFKWHDSKTPETDWNAQQLERVFSLIRRGIMDGTPPFPITYVVALTAIRAYGTVMGRREAREVWELLRPWLTINENVADQESKKIAQLERLVRRFESGENLDYAMSGGDAEYRVIDWRTY